MLCFLTFCQTAYSQSLTYKIFSSTNGIGFDMTLPSGVTLTSIPSVINAEIDASETTITEVNITQCSGSVFGPAVVTNTDVPVSLDLGLAGADVIELSTPVDSLGAVIYREQ